MKNIHLIVIILLICTGAAGAETKTPVRIAVKVFPPFVFEDLRGFSIDLADIICEKHDLKPEYIVYESVPEMLHAVESGACRLGVSGVTITAEREKRLDFSQPYFDSGLMIAVKTSGKGHMRMAMSILTRSMAVLTSKYRCSACAAACRSTECVCKSYTIFC